MQNPLGALGLIISNIRALNFLSLKVLRHPIHRTLTPNPSPSSTMRCYDYLHCWPQCSITSCHVLSTSRAAKRAKWDLVRFGGRRLIAKKKKGFAMDGRNDDVILSIRCHHDLIGQVAVSTRGETAKAHVHCTMAIHGMHHQSYWVMQHSNRFSKRSLGHVPATSLSWTWKNRVAYQFLNR